MRRLPLLFDILIIATALGVLLLNAVFVGPFLIDLAR